MVGAKKSSSVRLAPKCESKKRSGDHMSQKGSPVIAGRKKGLRDIVAKRERFVAAVAVD